MEPLRLRRADAAPGVGAVEYFGRLPASAIGDGELPCPALRLLAAVHLLMAVERNPTVCLATNRELAHACGRTGDPRSQERWV